MSATKKESTQLYGAAETAVASTGIAMGLIWGLVGLVLFVMSIIHGARRMQNGGNAWDVVCAVLFPGAYSIVAGVIDYGPKGKLGGKSAEEFIRSMQF